MVILFACLNVLLLLILRSKIFLFHGHWFLEQPSMVSGGMCMAGGSARMNLPMLPWVRWRRALSGTVITPCYDCEQCCRSSIFASPEHPQGS